MRRGIAHVAGRRICAVDFPRGPVRPIATSPSPAVIVKRLANARIDSVERFGKRLALAVSPLCGTGDEPRQWLVIEPRMTGLMLVTEPPTQDHVRMVIHLAPAPRRRSTGRLIFWDQRGLGTLRLLGDRGLQRACGAAALGPDGLLITGDRLRAALARSRRAVKVALLDQGIVAGIGNIYAAEILHRVGIDPRTPCRRITAAAWHAIADAARSLLAEAVRLEGSSIGDELYRTPASRLGRFQRRHRVYGRAGEPCLTCGTSIHRIVQAQRSTFFCPRCQPRRR